MESSKSDCFIIEGANVGPLSGESQSSFRQTDDAAAETGEWRRRGARFTRRHVIAMAETR